MLNDHEKQPLITVIIPVYNVSRYLKQCLDSVISQEYKNLEIIAVDDGSTDKSGSILDQYAELDNRVHVIHTDNHGLSAARNVALDQTHGEYIAFLDSDDWMELIAIKTLVHYMMQYDADIVVCGAYKEWMNVKIPFELPSSLTLCDKESACYELICQRFKYVVWNKLFKATLYKDIRFPEGRTYEDVATTYRLMDKVEKVILIPDILIHYRMRESSISFSSKLKNAEDRWQAYYEMFVNWKEKGEHFRNRLIQNCMYVIRETWFNYSAYCEQIEPTELDRVNELFHKMSSFSCTNIKYILGDKFSVKTKIFCILTLCNSSRYLMFLSSIYAMWNSSRKKKQPSLIKEAFL